MTFMMTPKWHLASCWRSSIDVKKSQLTLIDVNWCHLTSIDAWRSRYYKLKFQEHYGLEFMVIWIETLKSNSKFKPNASLKLILMHILRSRSCRCIIYFFFLHGTETLRIFWNLFWWIYFLSCHVHELNII